ncbi:hypothetical protein COO60DRAFT_555792 [Scenedesmus sp. NREL 46B-D3]|nr:hypothetical protein COO60DRAFT_555792 [Scenedesmus sp. NREL 46B-D3]
MHTMAAVHCRCKAQALTSDHEWHAAQANNANANATAHVLLCHREMKPATTTLTPQLASDVPSTHRQPVAVASLLAGMLNTSHEAVHKQNKAFKTLKHVLAIKGCRKVEPQNRQTMVTSQKRVLTAAASWTHACCNQSSSKYHCYMQPTACKRCLHNELQEQRRTKVIHRRGCASCVSRTWFKDPQSRSSQQSTCTQTAAALALPAALTNTNLQAPSPC